LLSSPNRASFSDYIDCLYDSTGENNVAEEINVAYGNFTGNTFENSNCIEPIK